MMNLCRMKVVTTIELYASVPVLVTLVSREKRNINLPVLNESKWNVCSSCYAHCPMPIHAVEYYMTLI